GALLRRLGVRGDYLLAAGTLEPRKNLARLAAAYAAARPSLPDPWPLLVVGPTGWGGVQAGGGDGVVAVGHVDDGVLAALYAGARAFAYVPLEEGFGFPPAEAMASGVPVVVSSAVPSIVGPPGAAPAALVVDPLSVDDIAGALVRMARDDDLRAELAARGAELVAPLTWAAAADAHIAWWEALR
ncbi:MAG: glycosyltransferase, partial [Acidimicrobiales bacterium]